MTSVEGLESLHASLIELRKQVRRQYPSTSKQVTAKNIRTLAGDIANRWLRDLSTRPEVRTALAPEDFADCTVAFQMLLRFSDQAATRGRYDGALKTILDDYGNRILVPVSQHRHVPVAPQATPAPGQATRIFVGHSFAEQDKPFVDSLLELLRAAGLEVLTGEAPQEGRISDKVRTRIEAADVFLGVFTRGTRLRGRRTYNTSAWVIDEKAYAYAKNKRLLLLKETGVESLGGIQGDYEYVEFDRASPSPALVKLLTFFNIRAGGLR